MTDQNAKQASYGWPAPHEAFQGTLREKPQSWVTNSKANITFLSSYGEAALRSPMSAPAGGHSSGFGKRTAVQMQDCGWGTRSSGTAQPSPANGKPQQLPCQPSRLQFSSLPHLPFTLNPRKAFPGSKLSLKSTEDSEAWPCWPAHQQWTVSVPFTLSYSKERRPKAAEQPTSPGCWQGGAPAPAPHVCSVLSD